MTTKPLCHRNESNFFSLLLDDYNKCGFMLNAFLHVSAHFVLSGSGGRGLMGAAIILSEAVILTLGISRANTILRNSPIIDTVQANTSSNTLKRSARTSHGSESYLAPGQNGTKQLLKKYGDQLVCVRYRHDKARQKRIKTIENHR
jgi:hypothetical protein